MSLHIETVGSGADVVLIHGWGMHGGVWSGVRDALAERYRVHVVDLPGMGWSKACSPCDLKRMAEVVAAELPKSAAICGWSLGGQVAMRLALDYPQQVDKLVLIGATPRFVNGADWQCGVAAEVFNLFASQVAADYHDTMTRFLGLQAFGGESSRVLMRELRERFFARPVPDSAVLQDALRILLDTDLRSELAGLQQPTLLIHGNRDTLAPVDASRWMAAHLPHARLRVIEGASHAPFLSHPTTFLSEVLQFLAPAAAGSERLSATETHT
jgi:pimeloyl-[acyl-carrier protein] methyl ester esterase